MLEIHHGYRRAISANDNSDLTFPAGTPFKGVVHSADFISGDALASAFGLTAGTSINSLGGWLHFIESTGLELYIAKKPIRYNVSWEQLNAVNVTSGAGEITINGDVYVVRLLTSVKSASGDLTQANTGGEWNRYMYNVYNSADRAGFPSDNAYWGDYTGPMLGVATYDASSELGVGTICTEATGTAHFTRGSDSGQSSAYAQITGLWYIDPNSPQNWYGWRPVLVKKSTIPPLPFRGEVLASNFITGSALAAAVGLTGPTLVNDTTPWLKFVDAGKTFYMSKKNTHQNLSWKQLNDLGCITGTKTIVIGGLTYKVRVMTGGDGNNPTNTAGGEYDHYFLRVTTSYPGSDGAWAAYSPADVGWNGNVTAGSMIICQEGSTQGGHVLRGYPGFTGIWYEPDDVPNVAYGWRPVLELVP